MSLQADRWIRGTTTGCVALLALIAGTVSYLHMHLLVELHGQPGWVAALTPLSVDGMIVAASTTLLADSRAGERGGVLPWALLVAGSAASLAANVAVAQPTAAGRVIAAWPSFALIGVYELLMRQVRRGAAIRGKPQHTKPTAQVTKSEDGGGGCHESGPPPVRVPGPGGPVVVRAVIFSGRPGTGPWPTGQPMDRFPPGARSPATTVVMSGGAVWSNARVPQVSSPPRLPGLACDWWNSPHRPRRVTAATTGSEHSSGLALIAF
jgi:hypothetical protein